MLCALAAASPATASVVISGTRVVLAAGDGEATVQLENTGASPALVQAWIDDGNAAETPENSKAPFLLTPPISRVDAGRGQALRILYSGGSLPGDRESVFWLNVLDVPPVPEDAEGSARNYLQFAFRSRIKLFYRPKGLAGTANAAPSRMVWGLLAPDTLSVRNPSAYHVTVVRLQAYAGDGDSNGATLETGGVMVAPGGSHEWRLPAPATRVEFTTINDHGGRISHAAGLVP